MTRPRRSIAPVAARLAKLLPMLASDKGGEVVAAADAISRTLHVGGLDWHDLVDALIRPPPREQPRTWAELVDHCLEHADVLDDRDVAFLNGVRASVLFGAEPSERQGKWLRDVWRRLNRRLAGEEAA